MKKVIFAILLTTLSMTGQAADIDEGKKKAVSCAGCHGVAGISANPAWPNLAGQKELYLAEQMKAFRSGARASALMGPMAKPLSDEDI